MKKIAPSFGTEKEATAYYGKTILVDGKRETIATRCRFPPSGMWCLTTESGVRLDPTVGYEIVD